MKQTVLHQKHLQANAKMIDIQGWQIPIQFSEIQDEYHAVRSAAGLFDVSYLGRIEVSGAGATPLLQKVLTRNMSKISVGTGHYGLLCNESGFILDDLLIFHLATSRYLLTTNMGNTEKVMAWLGSHAAGDVQLTDKTGTLAQFALQGPKTLPIIEKLTAASFKKLNPRAIREMTILDTNLLISRTGNTGEHGYELFIPADRAEAFWNAIINAVPGSGILPCGFASRDILRLEMGYLLYGNDLDETRTPLEAGLSRFVDFKKDFIGMDALLKLKQNGTRQKLTGFMLLDKGVPKTGGSIFSESREIGVVTSGCQSPRRSTGIGLGYVVSRYAQPGQEIEIEVRDKEIAAKTMDPPFYKRR
jgi:aminomethyltransferase